MIETNRYLVSWWQLANDEWIDRDQYIYAPTPEDARKQLLAINRLARNVHVQLDLFEKEK